jgi:hypothetical protein
MVLKIYLLYQIFYMKPRVAKYFRRGFTMSRRARISHRNNEHPITHWMKMLALDKKTILKMLVCIGVHHTGMYAQRTVFYRLPKFNKEEEMKRFFKVYNSIPATKRKFIEYMAAHLQQEVRNYSLKSTEQKVDKPVRYIKLKDIFLD